MFYTLHTHINTATDLLYALCNKLCEGIINNRHCTPQCYCERGIDQSDNLWSRTRKRQYHGYSTMEVYQLNGRILEYLISTIHTAKIIKRFQNTFKFQLFIL